MKVHLIDGTYELFRAHYSKAPQREDPQGRPVRGLYGLLRSLCAMLAEPEVTHVAVAFDTVIESFRNELFLGYKTGAGIEPDLLRLFPLVEEGCEALGLVVWRMREFEADDALASGAARWADHPEVEQVVLGSPDKDLAQCVRGEQVVLWDRRRKLFLDEAAVLAKYDVPPRLIPDWLALVGDDADGIPGLPRWGAKSSAGALRHFGGLAQIPDDVEAWDLTLRGKAALAEILAGQRQAAALYRTLATLREDVPLAESLEDLRWRGPRPELEAFCAEHGFESLLERVPTPG